LRVLKKKKEGQHVRAQRLESAWRYFTEMCSGSEAGSYVRLIDFVYHSTLGWRVIKKKKKDGVREFFYYKTSMTTY